MFTDRPTRKQKNIGLGVVVFTALFILTLILAPTPGNPQSLANIQPELLAAAAEQPAARLSVIVQKTTAADNVETAVMELGGAITQPLNLINGFAAEIPGQNLAQLAATPGVHRVSLDAPVVRVSLIDSEYVRDEFNTESYVNNDGTVAWRGDWEEMDNDDEKKGVVQANESVYCASTYCLRFGKNGYSWENISIWREANLAGATDVALTFSYRRRKADTGDAAVTLQVSPDGGSSWTNLATYPVNVHDGDQIQQSFDISPYADKNTQIRFIGSGQADGRTVHIYFDNIQIEYTDNGANVFPRAIRANQLWHEDPRIKGKNVTVAVVDSGIANHADLQEDASSAFRVAAEVDFLNNSPTPDDLYGHGTHVAGIIGGNGKALNAGNYGIAPKANLVDIKVIGDNGSGTISDVVAGLEWIYANKDIYNIRVVNLSLNSTVAESYHNSPLNAAAEILWFNGVTVIASAGNNGSTNPGILYPPANDPFIIVVGAADDKGTPRIVDDTITSYSAYGVTQDGYAKPDLVAPGHQILSLLASDNANLALGHPENVATSGANGYFNMSGTSMASAVVSGAVAQLLQDEPNLTPDQVKYRLMSTARTTDWPGYDSQKAGAGYLDIQAAVHSTAMDSANEGNMPHMLLAKMALIAYWANENGGGANIDWANVDWDTVNWDTVDWNSVNWGSVNWGSVNWGSVNWGSVNWGSVNWGSVNWGSVNWGSVNWGSVNWGSVNWGSVNAPSFNFSE